MSALLSTFGFITNASPWQILFIVFIILLLFGAKRLPELFRGLGQGLKEFKKATRDIEEDIRSAVDEDPKKKKPEPTPEKSENKETAPVSRD